MAAAYLIIWSYCWATGHSGWGQARGRSGAAGEDRRPAGRRGRPDPDPIGAVEGEGVVGVAGGCVAVVQEGVVAGAGEEAVVEVGGTAFRPGAVMVKVGDATLAAGEAAVAAVSDGGGSALGDRPVPGRAAESERLFLRSDEVGDGGGVAGDPVGGSGIDRGAVYESRVGVGDEVDEVAVGAGDVAVVGVGDGHAGHVHEGVGLPGPPGPSVRYRRRVSS